MTADMWQYIGSQSLQRVMLAYTTMDDGWGVGWRTDDRL